LDVGECIIEGRPSDGRDIPPERVSEWVVLLNGPVLLGAMPELRRRPSLSMLLDSRNYYYICSAVALLNFYLFSYYRSLVAPNRDIPSAARALFLFVATLFHS
jgi:hypothetical protein